MNFSNIALFLLLLLLLLQINFISSEIYRKTD